jgi:hypothetical protein
LAIDPHTQLIALNQGHTTTVLLPRHPQLDHHPLVPFVIDRKMAMEENAAVFLKMRTRDGLAARTVGVEGRGPQDDVLAVERAVALANRHGRLTRVEPHGGEAICFGVEARDSSAGALRSVRIEEGEIRLQKLPVVAHVLLTSAFRDDWLSVHWEERFDDVPFASKLREQLLTGTRRVRWLVLIVGLLRDRRSGNEQRRDNPSLHGATIICQTRNDRTPYGRETGDLRTERGYLAFRF